MNTKNMEVEFKYDAKNINLSAFKEFCMKKDPVSYIMAAGHDHFYHNSKDLTSFYRHRVGAGINQFTFKKKTVEENNFIRIEHNIDLDLDVTRDKILYLCKDLGYEYNTTIFKNSFIYVYEYYVMAYYIVYDNDMKEIGRFLEIEMNEEFPWENEKQAWGELIILERIHKPLGIDSSKRIKDSLFELFKKAG